jgi:hypothetical protein
MAFSGLIEIYDPKERLCGETIVCVAREFNCTWYKNGDYTTARPCCRVKAKSEQFNAYAIVTKVARVVNPSDAVPRRLTDAQREMMNKKLLGEKLVCEGVDHGRERKVKLSHTHHGRQMDINGNTDHLVYAVIDQPAKVFGYYLRRMSK